MKDKQMTESPGILNLDADNADQADFCGFFFRAYLNIRQRQTCQVLET